MSAYPPRASVGSSATRAFSPSSSYLYEFGDGWSFTRSDVRMVVPVPAVLAALPKAWTPGTSGRVRGIAMKAKFEKAEDLDARLPPVQGPAD